MKSTLKIKARNIPTVCSRWTYLSYEGYSPFSQIDQSKHCEGSIGVLSQTAVAHLGESLEMLERQERMLNLGSHTRLFTIGVFVNIGQWTIPVRTLIGKVPRVGCDGFETLPLILTPVSAIAAEPSLITVQEVWQFLAVMQITRSHTDAVYQSSLTIHPNMYLHSKVPLIAFLALAHLRITRLLSVLGGGRCGNQRAERSPRKKYFHTRQKRQKRHLASRSAVNLKSFDCCQCHFLHRIPSYSQDYLSDHMKNGSFITYLVFP